MQHMLMESIGRWMQIACCMDTVDDAQLAVDAYDEIEAGRDDEGQLYLAVYGVLQARAIIRRCGNRQTAILPFLCN